MKVWRDLSPNGRVVAATVGTVLAMGSLGWAAVPLYSLFCQVTGFAGTTSRAEVNDGEVLDRTVLVRFDATKEKTMPWTFKPVQTSMRVRIGETNIAFYEASNPTDHPVAGTAAYNVAPEIIGGYFVKIACFCFEEQILAPGETVSMPVTFYVDPSIIEDGEASDVPEITLSYTFYETDLPADYAAITTDATVTTN